MMHQLWTVEKGMLEKCWEEEGEAEKKQSLLEVD